jgi:lipase chaperone LimK
VRPAVAAGTVAAALLVALALALDGGRPRPAPGTRAPAPPTMARGSARRPPIVLPAASVAAAAPSLPPSLRGAALDGAITVAGGRVVLDADLRRLFDHVLTAAGEVADAELRELVAAEARRRVPGHERALLAAYDRYLGYLGAAQDAVADSRGGPPRAHLAQVTALQGEHFGADAAAMFGADNALALASLDRSDVLSRGDLSPADREAALAAIEGRLPPAMRQQRARMRAPAAARDAVAEVRRRGGSDAEIYAVRASHLGDAAAQRLAELDRSRASRDH